MSLAMILSCLPRRAAEAVAGYREEVICEIRLRAGRPLTVTTPSANILTPVVCTAKELEEVVDRLCGGSLHAYGETIRCGYIPLPDGGRAGVCGRLSGGGVREITSVCLRIPRTVKGVGLSLCRRLLACRGQGMLLYAPPGEGKTTLLRDMAVTLSSPPYLRRVSVIDSRGELYREDAFAGSTAEIYLGYPKGEGIEMATRTMSPQFILCDELGAEEANSVMEAQSCGVPLIASAHASSLAGLLQRPAFARLHEAGIFRLYVGLERMGQGFRFDITERETIRSGAGKESI